MKPAAFEYERPSSVAEATRLLSGTPGARLLAGGQTLGPMLNLRLARPQLLIDITRIRELAVVEVDAEAITIGATVTHAAIEDGRCGIPAPMSTFLGSVARGIAYRAVRNRGTIGGSIAHVDPAADWLSCLTALGAEVVIAGPAGERTAPVIEFVRGAMEPDLAAGEMIRALRIPRFSQGARFGFHKICRKAGEFAEAIGVVVADPESGRVRAVAGATADRPLLIDMQARSSNAVTVGEALTLLEQAHFAGDTYERKIHAVALKRAHESALAS